MNNTIKEVVNSWSSGLGAWMLAAALMLSPGSQVQGAEKAEFITKIEAHREGVTALQFSNQGDMLLSGSMDGTAMTWRVEDGSKVKRVARNGRDIHDAHFSPDGMYVLTTGSKKNITIWNTETGRKEKVIKGPEAVQREYQGKIYR